MTELGELLPIGNFRPRPTVAARACTARLRARLLIPQTQGHAEFDVFSALHAWLPMIRS
jgi:hypothetical protein